MASMCLLTKKKTLWLVAMLIALIATLMMVSARMAEAPLKGSQAAQSLLTPKAASPPGNQ
jgi:hypothetical protein